MCEVTVSVQFTRPTTSYLRAVLSHRTQSSIHPKCKCKNEQHGAQELDAFFGSEITEEQRREADQCLSGAQSARQVSAERSGVRGR